MPQISNSLNPYQGQMLRPPVPMLPFPMDDDTVPPPPPLPAMPPVDVSDLMAQMNALLQPPIAPAPQPRGIGGVLQALLAQLPQAVAVGMSKDPAAALGEQLRETRAMNFQREQYERARKDKLEDLRRQVGIDVIRGEIEQKREIGRENRRYQQQVGLIGQEQAFRKGERQAEAQSRLQLADIEQRGRERLQQSGFENAKVLADMNFQNDVQLKSVELGMKYAAAGMKGDQAYDIAKRSLQGKLTAADQKVLNEVHAREFGEITKERKLGQRLTLAQIRKLEADAAESRAKAAAASGAGGLNGEMMKVFTKGLEDAIKTQRVVLANGEIAELAGLDTIQQTNIKRFLSQEESLQRFMNGPGKMLLAGIAKGFNPTAGINITGADKTTIAQSLDAQVKQFKDAKVPDNKIVEGLLQYGQQNNRGQDVTDALIRNGLEKVAKIVVQDQIKQNTAGGKVREAPKPKYQSSIGGTGPIPQGLRWLEQKMVELDQYMKSQPPPGMAPPLSQSNPSAIMTKPAEPPKPLGLLPPFRPEVVTQPLARGNAAIEDAFGRLRVPNEYAEYGNPGNIGRGIERGIESLRGMSMNPTGNLQIDLLLERIGLIPPGSAVKAQAQR